MKRGRRGRGDGGRGREGWREKRREEGGDDEGRRGHVRTICMHVQLRAEYTNVYRPGCRQCMQLYTIDVCRCAMRIEQGGYRVYCVHVWPYPRCGSDRLPYILERWSQMLRIIGNSWKKQPKQ